LKCKYLFCEIFQEIAAILISFDKHSEWQSKEVKTRWVTWIWSDCL